jgi:hypothetical protein
MNGADDWVERLLADLKSASTTTWEGGKEAFRTMPNTIERVIRWHLDRVDSNLCRSYCERAIFHFERLVEQSDLNVWSNKAILMPRRCVRRLHDYDFKGF